MASKIDASTAGAGGLITTADNSGVLQLQSGGTTIATISSTGLQTNVGAPAFSAYASTATNTATATFTKLAFDTEEFDTNNNFSSSRFTPTVAGYYQINAAVNAGANLAYALITIYKNGSLYKYGNVGGPVGNNALFTVSSLVYLNGTTDYVEIYWQQSSGATVNSAAGSALTYFNGAMIRSA